MKNVFRVAIVLTLLFILSYGVNSTIKAMKISDLPQIEVLLAYNPKLFDEFEYILKAYKSVLEEEGVPLSYIDANELLKLNPKTLNHRVPAIIFPDDLCMHIPLGFRSWIDEYLNAGGNIAVIYNAGIKDLHNLYLKESLFAEYTGVNNITYHIHKQDTFTRGKVVFASPSKSDYMEIPYGKVMSDGSLSTYMYGTMDYIMARNLSKHNLQDSEIYAYSIPSGDARRYPAIVIRNYGRGKALYVNLPLGYIKANADDLPMRAILRTFLFKEARIPHLCNTPFGKGGIVINWHIDNNQEWEYLPKMIENGFLRDPIDTSMHITAGDFVDTPGDELGFQACGKGKEIIDKLEPYGVIGSHGGWGHNWFCRSIEANIFHKPEIKKYIVQNNQCLESVVKYKIIEYSAPNGTHPQPDTTEILEELGIVCYYYTGDTGSVPNRTFFGGKMVSDKVVAFPVLPFGKAASFYEMNTRYSIPPEEFKKWLFKAADYSTNNRTVKLIYSHPRDLFEGTGVDYQEMFGEFMDYIENLQAAGRLILKPMNYFANFLLHILKTKYSFDIDENNNLKVSLANSGGLQSVTFAIPKNQYKKPEEEGLSVDEDNYYYYVTIKADIYEKVVNIQHN